MSDSVEHDQPVYTIDAHDRVVFVNAAWVDFWAAQGGADARANHVGRPVWDYLGQGETRLLWELLYRRVRAAGVAVFVPMRVDTPTERRLVEIELRPLAERSVEHVCERIWSESRPAVPLLDASWPRDGRTLRSCAWCARIQVALGLWQEIEDAQVTLGLGDAATLPTLTAHACVTCKQSLLKTLPLRVA